MNSSSYTSSFAQLLASPLLQERQHVSYYEPYHWHAAYIPELYHYQDESPAPSPQPPQRRTRGRRVNMEGNRIFDCKNEGCGKVFKRSEHLKRHVRSIHTMEKPFKCPYTSCNKRFSRSDNLNQHIRIHRHTKSACSSTTSSPSCTTFATYPI